MGGAEKGKPRGLVLCGVISACMALSSPCGGRSCTVRSCSCNAPICRLYSSAVLFVSCESSWTAAIFVATCFSSSFTRQSAWTADWHFTQASLLGGDSCKPSVSEPSLKARCDSAHCGGLAPLRKFCSGQDAPFQCVPINLHNRHRHSKQDIETRAHVGAHSDRSRGRTSWARIAWKVPVLLSQPKMCLWSLARV